MSSSPHYSEPQRDDNALRLARLLSHWLDDRYVDPILGLLLPGVGDAVGALLGLLLVLIAVHRRVPPVVVARMLLNVAADSLVGIVPVAGDAFDFYFKANRRNLALLEQRLPQRRSHWTDWLVVWGAAVLALAAVTAPIVFLVWIGSRIIGAHGV